MNTEELTNNVEKQLNPKYMNDVFTYGQVYNAIIKATEELKQEIANHVAVNSLLLDSSEEAKLANHIHELQSVLQHKDETIKKLKEALRNVLKVAKSPTLTTHGMNHLEIAKKLLTK